MFRQMHEFYISQGTVETFFGCGGQIQKHFCRIFVRINIPIIIHIGVFLTELFKKIKYGHLLDTVKVVTGYSTAYNFFHIATQMRSVVVFELMQTAA